MSTNFTASGLITISGSPEASSSYFSVIGLGGIAIAGESTIRGFFSYGGSGSASVTGFFVSHFSRYGSGSANVSYLSTAQTEVSVLYSFPFSFDVYDEFNFSYTFSYDIGDRPKF